MSELDGSSDSVTFRRNVTLDIDGRAVLCQPRLDKWWDVANSNRMENLHHVLPWIGIALGCTI